MQRSRILLMLLLASVMAVAQDEPKKNAAATTSSHAFDVKAAERFANLALACVHKEYPNKIAHNLNSDADVAPPRKLTPAFYGCYDWHSSVHGHWLLARLARTFPDAPFAAPAMAALQRSITPENIAQEVRYINGDGRTSFERPYGLAWLLQLGQELREWNDPQAQELSRTLLPLEDAAKKRLMTWLPKLSYPIRIGEHSQSAFGFGLMLDAARESGDKEFATLVEKKAREFYGNDKACPLTYEPSGEDFLSPCLGEADLMRRVMKSDEFAKWLTAFFPTLRSSNTLWLKPVVSPDPSDPKLAHLDGLNLSRAWMLEGIASGLPKGDPKIAKLRATAKAHREAGLAAVTGEHYEGGHWLGSFAVYLVTRRGIRASEATAQARQTTRLSEESGEADETVSRAELIRLRPVVKRDLKELLNRVNNDGDPSAADLEDEFERCRFTPLRLGSLGPAILVEAAAGHGAGANATMLNVYVPTRTSYRRIIEEAGFGPAIMPGSSSVPDLVFGWKMGYCGSTLQRYHYANGQFAVDACDREDRDDARGTCEVKACERPTRTFPDPWLEAEQSHADPPPRAPYFVAPGLTGKEILEQETDQRRKR